MEPASHKTTILLTPTLYERLSRLARARGVSMGHLIRRAVEAQYGVVDPDARLAAVQELGALELPVDDPEVMKAESSPYGHEPRSTLRSLEARDGADLERTARDDDVAVAQEGGRPTH